MAKGVSPHTTKVPGWDPTSRMTLQCAVRLVRMYGENVPAYQRLMSDFGISKATAFRWARALRETV